MFVACCDMFIMCCVVCCSLCWTVLVVCCVHCGSGSVLQKGHPDKY